MLNFDLKTILYTLPAVIIGLTVHECAHALAAYKLGDVTAKEEGRTSFNPLHHIDPIGFFFIVFFGFGWAKPVRFNSENLKHPRRDRCIIAAAGPLSNFIVGIAVLFFIKLLVKMIRLEILQVSPDTFNTVLNLLFFLAITNLGLFIFNILPLPPLDGSHIFFSGLNLDSVTEKRIIRFGALALLLIILIDRNTGIDILPISFLIDKVVGLFF